MRRLVGVVLIFLILGMVIASGCITNFIPEKTQNEESTPPEQNQSEYQNHTLSDEQGGNQTASNKTQETNQTKPGPQETVLVNSTNVIVKAIHTGDFPVGAEAVYCMVMPEGERLIGLRFNATNVMIGGLVPVNGVYIIKVGNEDKMSFPLFYNYKKVGQIEIIPGEPIEINADYTVSVSDVNIDIQNGVYSIRGVVNVVSATQENGVEVEFTPRKGLKRTVGILLIRYSDGQVIFSVESATEIMIKAIPERNVQIGSLRFYVGGIPVVTKKVSVSTGYLRKIILDELSNQQSHNNESATLEFEASIYKTPFVKDYYGNKTLFVPVLIKIRTDEFQEFMESTDSFSVVVVGGSDTNEIGEYMDFDTIDGMESVASMIIPKIKAGGTAYLMTTVPIMIQHREDVPETVYIGIVVGDSSSKVIMRGVTTLHIEDYKEMMGPIGYSVNISEENSTLILNISTHSSENIIDPLAEIDNTFEPVLYESTPTGDVQKVEVNNLSEAIEKYPIAIAVFAVSPDKTMDVVYQLVTQDTSSYEPYTNVDAYATSEQAGMYFVYILLPVMNETVSNIADMMPAIALLSKEYPQDNIILLMYSYTGVSAIVLKPKTPDAGTELYNKFMEADIIPVGVIQDESYDYELIINTEFGTIEDIEVSGGEVTANTGNTVLIKAHAEEIHIRVVLTDHSTPRKIGIVPAKSYYYASPAIHEIDALNTFYWTPE